ncbi:PDDEXK nuclease domain-containing protein [Niabella hibiscisoli]|uniref:PDDEXK nuclease domain-containing protein n=1 Tax=Niabella hibiscisoli TaxID=1825928 RepID=UPI001F0E1608|nr:PDDEXK nuclease domain-containing protein [Niabella hibiscisoli]MCH5716879.1 PDDEXK nuclease domain-containing protein [Niabella hibiscisoli]
MLAKDLKTEFPKLKGFSVRNLKYMRKFALDYPRPVIEQLIIATEQLRSEETSITKVQKTLTTFVQQVAAQMQNSSSHQTKKMQQPAAQNEVYNDLFLQSILARISWSHHLVLMDKVPNIGQRLWYMLHVIERGISRNILGLQIEGNLFERQIKAKKITNFARILPLPQSDMANYLLKDPYIFDFVQAKENADERDIESQLANHVTKFLLELGKGFAFISRQQHFQIGGSDFYSDLIFYHTRLKCYVVVELKARPFQPGDVSQLNFYVNLVNDKLKAKDDNPTIGLLLCKGKNEVVAEYSLMGISNALGISDYQLSKVVPEEIKSQLPDIKEIEKELKELD